MRELASRAEALKDLLRPLQWDWSSGIDYRIRYVSSRIEEVSLVIPFLNNEEKKFTKEWLEEAYKTSSQLCD